VEEVLYWLRRLELEKRIPVVPVYVDSPMASSALNYYTARVAELDADMRPSQKGVSMFATARFQAVASVQQSKELTASRRPAIVISSSGMATGGRVLHHMASALPQARNTILFVGYQAAGTRGRALTEGAEEVRIHGQMVPALARIAKIDSMSAHADRSEIVRWLQTSPVAPGRVCLVHGEARPMDALKARLEQQFGWAVHTPQYRESLAL
jgi:metallo-beta-lactamase family protein